MNCIDGNWESEVISEMKDKKMKVKISVVIPVYNSEKYIRRCVDSVLAQTYQEWELVLVDDGSTDNSLSILQEYESKDERIKVIHQNNAGPGIARNIGIQYVSGDYIVFIDSDDIIKKDYFNLLSKKTEDVVFIDIDQVDENYNMIKREYMSDFQKLSKDDFLRSQMTGKIPWGGVRKALRTELLKKNQIMFSTHKIGEEAIYSFMLLWKAKTFSFIRGSVYQYVNRVGSQSDLGLTDPWGNVAVALKEKVKDLGLYDEYADTINAFILTAAIVSLDKLASMYNRKQYRIKAKECLKKCRAEIDRNYPVDFRHMSRKAKVIYLFVALHALSLIYFISRLRRSRM